MRRGALLTYGRSVEPLAELKLSCDEEGVRYREGLQI
jgi:hypothetical protein